MNPVVDVAQRLQTEFSLFRPDAPPLTANEAMGLARIAHATLRLYPLFPEGFVRSGADPGSSDKCA